MINKPVFIDCGYHQGGGLRLFKERLSLDASWDIFAFEPNPACHRYFPDFCKHGWHYSPKAVWTKAESLFMRQENREESKSASPVLEHSNKLDGWGSTIIAENQNPGLSRSCIVPAFDLARLLRLLPERMIHVKMDIEGAEFPVLRHLLKDGSIALIDHLYVEFHERLLPRESEISRDALMRECEKHTVVNLYG